MPPMGIGLTTTQDSGVQFSPEYMMCMKGQTTLQPGGELGGGRDWLWRWVIRLWRSVREQCVDRPHGWVCDAIYLSITPEGSPLQPVSRCRHITVDIYVYTFIHIYIHMRIHIIYCTYNIYANTYICICIHKHNI